MGDRDMRPTRFDLSLEYAREFINEWFDQNPLGQIGIVGMRGGIGERVCEMSGTSQLCLSKRERLVDDLRETGNPQDVLKAISERHKLEPTGEPSLQNAIEMARSSMRYISFSNHRFCPKMTSYCCCCQPPADSLLPRDVGHLRLSHDRRPGQYLRNPLFLR